ncbi:hypothetical protein PTE30175_00573 [Pandoraea terrae]|uniref:Uncharacterized protein n=1 Tax=Pandoraea terrae TaxID=1537710 RepID=A0A5E4SA98_9BURK|nr:hypothetical protein [Pandoraea terrae]VVD71138.1 hypothetical protein PTE30175_00573 [Pandoraea terrae]
MKIQHGLLAAFVCLMLTPLAEAGVKHAAHEVKDATVHAAKKTGGAARDAAHATGHAIKDVAHNIADKSREGYHATKRAVHKAVE